MDLYDLIIIGAGPAGITAGIYAARQKMKTLILTMDIGGQTVWSGNIENYAGYQIITGVELTAKFEEHLKNYDLEVKENKKVIEIRGSAGAFDVLTKEDAYSSRTVIVSSGKKSKDMGVPGEKEFRNRGLAYCATCDAPVFSGKKVAVIGGGNAAMEACLQLLTIAEHIHVVNNTPELGGDAIVREKVVSAANVTVMNDTEVLEVFGDKFVEGIKVSRGGHEETIPLEGVFVEIGLIPNSDFKSDVEKNEDNEIKVNCRNETNIPGIFAAGDVTDVPEKQIIVAAGEGAKAARSAFKFLATKKENQ